ncbi:MAG TPA: hypothetical protein VLZ83_06485, partial [Edaphocola sp.]|nr:hypothetical protein [Edaphocola sp.]
MQCIILNKVVEEKLKQSANIIPFRQLVWHDYCNKFIMSKPQIITLQETQEELNVLFKKSSIHLRPR